MKDGREIKDLKYKVLVCMNDAYKKGYKQGYNDGHEKGMIDGVMNIDVNEVSYVKGLNDAWECAKKILNMDEPMIDDVFDEKVMLYKQIFEKYSASEAIYKIQKYEAEKRCSEIQVGDEVYNLDPENVRVVTAIYDDDKGHKQAVQICKNGKYGVDKVDTLKKTGKHYNGIENILYEMKGENE